MSDLVTRLRGFGPRDGRHVANEAADELERLTALLAEREKALRDHGIEIVEGGYKYEDNSALSPKPCTWMKTQMDAARYRWLKANHLQLGPDCWIRTGDDLDDAIDAAIAAGEKPRELEEAEK